MEAKELQQRIDAHDAPLIVDARTSIEYKHGHVPGAISAPLGKILVHKAQLPNERMVVTCHGGERAWIARKVLARSRLPPDGAADGSHAALEEGRAPDGDGRILTRSTPGQTGHPRPEGTYQGSRSDRPGPRSP